MFDGPGLNSWGLTVKILARSFDLGGTRLVSPRVLLRWQHGQAFVKFFKSPHTFQVVVSWAYHNWAAPLGICTSLANFHFFQLGTDKLSGLPSLACRLFCSPKPAEGLFLNPPLPCPWQSPFGIMFCFATVMVIRATTLSLCAKVC